MIEINISKLAEEIKKRKAKLVAMQFPDGLKTKAEEIADQIEKETGAKTIVFAEPCFGACDLKDREAKELGADLLLHFGHSALIGNEKLPTIYIEAKYRVNKEKIKKAIKKLEEILKKERIQRVAIGATVQYLEHTKIVSEELEKKGFGVLSGKGEMLASYQVLGCNYSGMEKQADKAQALVFVGDGRFHAIGMGLEFNKKVFIINPSSGTVNTLGLEKEKLVRKRISFIEHAKDAKKFGLLVSTKPGQQNLKKALEIKEELEKKEKKSIIFISENILPEHYIGLGIDVFVNTACPRIALDDESKFNAPVLSIEECEVVIEKKKIEDLFILD